MMTQRMKKILFVLSGHVVVPRVHRGGHDRRRYCFSMRYAFVWLKDHCDGCCFSWCLSLV